MEISERLKKLRKKDYLAFLFELNKELKKSLIDDKKLLKKKKKQEIIKKIHNRRVKVYKKFKEETDVNEKINP